MGLLFELRWTCQCASGVVNMAWIILESQSPQFIGPPPSASIYGTQQVIAQRTTSETTNALPTDINDLTVGTFPNTYLQLTTAVLPFGNYTLRVCYSWNLNSIADSFLARLNINTFTSFAGLHREYPTNAGGSGGDTPPGSGTSQRYWVSYELTFLNIFGTHKFDLEFATSKASVEATMISANMNFHRIS